MARLEYPLEALRQVRDERAEAQVQSLAAQVARCQAAEAALLERERVRREHAGRAAESRRIEQARLAAGAITGTDLLRASEFEAATRAQAESLERAEADARQLLARERAEEHKLRKRLADLEAEAELVRQHEAGFRRRHAEAAEKAQEEAALEQWNARRR